MSAWVVAKNNGIYKIVGSDNSKNFWLSQDSALSAIELTSQQYSDLIYNHKCVTVNNGELSFEDNSKTRLDGTNITNDIDPFEIEQNIKQLKKKITNAIQNNENPPQEWTTIKNYLNSINVDTLPSGQSFCWQTLCQDNSINLDGILEF